MYQQFKKFILDHNAYHSESVTKLKRLSRITTFCLLGLIATIVAMHAITHQDLRNIVGAGLLIPLIAHLFMQPINIFLLVKHNSWKFKQTFQYMFLKKPTFDFLEFKANMEQTFFVFAKYHQLPILKKFYSELMNNAVQTETFIALNNALIHMPEKVESNEDIQSFDEMAEKFNSNSSMPLRFFSR